MCSVVEHVETGAVNVLKYSYTVIVMEGFRFSVSELKKMDVPASPKKSSRDLTCAVIAKSLSTLKLLKSNY